MTVQLEEKGMPKQLAQVCVAVPDNAKRDETVLTVYVPRIMENSNSHSCVKVKVPPMAEPGQTMVLTKYGTGWEVGVATCSLPESITITVPNDALPGESDVPIMYRGLEVTRVPLPEWAKPGVDEVRADRPSDPSEPWAVTLQVDPDYPELVRNMAVGAAQTSLRASPLDSNIAYQRLVEAVTLAGGYVNPKMMRGQAPPLNIPGIIAREDIAEGETICKIPKALHVSPFTAEAYAPNMWKGMTLQGTGLRAQEAALFAVGARLLQDAEDRAVAREADSLADLSSQSAWLTGADSQTRMVWEAYMDQLLGEDFTDHPLRKAGEDPEAAKAVLRPSCMASHLYMETKCMQTLYRLVSNSGDLLGARFESGMYLRAMLNFQSRQFKAAVSKSLVPVADLLNHAPFAEMGVAWGWNEGEQAHVLTAVRAIRAGAELLQSYGNHSNAAFYRCYNFTLPPCIETAWCYSLWKDNVPDIFAQFVPPDSQVNLSEVHLSSSEVSASLRDTLRDIAQSGGNPAFFLRVACQRCMQPFTEFVPLQPALQSLERKRKICPGSCAWWECLDVADRALAFSDIVRIHMCEYLCLVAYLEAVSVVAGEMSENGCLLHARGMRQQIKGFIFELHAIHHFK